MALYSVLQPLDKQRLVGAYLLGCVREQMRTVEKPRKGAWGERRVEAPTLSTAEWEGSGK